MTEQDNLLTPEELMELQDMRSTSLGDVGHDKLVAQRQIAKLLRLGWKPLGEIRNSEFIWQQQIEYARQQTLKEVEKYHRDEGGLELSLTWEGIVIDEPDWQSLKSGKLPEEDSK